MTGSAAADSIIALVMIGMGLSFFGADPKASTSRALALCLNLGGVTLASNVALDIGLVQPFSDEWQRLLSIAEAAAFATGFEWLLRVQRTESSTDNARAGSERLVRIAQGLIGIYGLMGLVFPELRNTRGARLLDPGFYLLAIPLGLSLLLVTVSVARLLTAKPDSAERLRLNAFGLALPFLMSGMWMPLSPWRPVAVAIGEMIFLAGAIRYHVAQGQRGQFLARFLSPQVTRLVTERGLAVALQQSRVELSVVACDLRGFTAFSETAAPEDVMLLLRQYWGAVGEVVGEHGGTIKDFAGDGILSLVGAPIPYDDHAQRAVAIGLGIRERVGQALLRWRNLGIDLGLGIGIASGYVTVGAIEGPQRIEYAAIGSPANLAARLCDYARPGQVLVDRRTVGLAGDCDGIHFEELEPVEFKGFARAQTIFAVAGKTRD